ncbi:MAG: HTH domain-containing protein [Gammaproteobacteria bacterium]|nr:HTH domain-containing protein [Gammaproteobacteria bacterium]
MKTLKAGTTKDFFASARETAREIDENRAVTQKDIIWIEADTMLELLKINTTDVIKTIRNASRITYTELEKNTGRSRASLNKDIRVLEQVGIVRVQSEKNAGHGQHKVVEIVSAAPMEFKAVI